MWGNPGWAGRSRLLRPGGGPGGRPSPVEAEPRRGGDPEDGPPNWRRSPGEAQSGDSRALSLHVPAPGSGREVRSQGGGWCLRSGPRWRAAEQPSSHGAARAGEAETTRAAGAAGGAGGADPARFCFGRPESLAPPCLSEDDPALVLPLARKLAQADLVLSCCCFNVYKQVIASNSFRVNKTIHFQMVFLIPSSLGAKFIVTNAK